MTDNVTQLFANPDPVEIDVDITDAEFDAIADMIARTPNDVVMNFNFNLIAEDGFRVFRITADIPKK